MKLIIIIFLFILSFNGFSKNKKYISCSYQNGIKTLIVDAEKSNLLKIKKNNENTYYLGIMNTQSLSELDDYLTIEKNGKKVTYSLKCNYIEQNNELYNIDFR